MVFLLIILFVIFGSGSSTGKTTSAPSPPPLTGPFTTTIHGGYISKKPQQKSVLIEPLEIGPFTTVHKKRPSSRVATPPLEDNNSDDDPIGPFQVNSGERLLLPGVSCRRSVSLPISSESSTDDFSLGWRAPSATTRRGAKSKSTK